MSVLAANSHILYREIYQRERQQQLRINGSCLLLQTNCGYFGSDKRNRKWKKIIAKRGWRVAALWSDLSRPSSVEMEPINDSDRLDQVLLRAQELSQRILIYWMAAWCIYLKPKLEKLAAEYDTKIKFYCVDVNKKMPTIQVWKDGEIKEQVIGGHRAWLVIEEVRQMIQKFV